ncbi:ribosomal protein S1 [Lepidopterella palustris CBS 459.81]|uniref:Ribosomal protein S1 n=1 Tax=Lepidopterella palustris CBS 459.81 TaxID=1314670 RepID=A0A8E2EIH4_9PEZI|nr:ribosomal protein S1 [Lepidopterella palustris CBS 459.81]
MRTGTTSFWPWSVSITFTCDSFHSQDSNQMLSPHPFNSILPPTSTHSHLPPIFSTQANPTTHTEGDFGDGPKIHKIRITLTSKNVKSLEKVCQELIDRAKTKDLRVKGPVRLPTKILKITTRKTPNGEGSKTWDTFEMRVHKRLIDLNAPTEVVKQIIINIEAGVEVEVTIAA